MKNGRLIYILIIGFVVIYSISAMVRYGDSGAARQADSVRQMIDKALVQIYALEGSYPGSISHVENYGIILDFERYFYHYEWHGSNMKPTLIVVER